MRKSILTLLGLAACCAGALAQSPKLPLQSDDQGTVYVNPNVSSTEKSLETKGATVGVERPDGSGAYGGVDASGAKPSYSAGGSTGGKTSFSAGATSDGKKDSTGLKAGVTIKY
jgi:hypothetical protein